MHRNLILSLVVALLLGPIAGSASAKLVGHWRMDEGAGTVAYDTSGYGNNGNLRGDPAWTTGALGGALQLDGVDDFVEIPHSARLTVDDEVTVTAWLYAERYTGPNGAGYQGELLILDEPFTGLDEESSEALRSFLLSLRRFNKAVLLVTHEVREAREIADDLLILDRGRTRYFGEAPPSGKIMDLYHEKTEGSPP